MNEPAIDYQQDEDPAEAGFFSPEESTSLLQQFAEADNICELLENQHLGEIAQRVLQELEIDKGSRGDWDQKMKDAMDMALQVSQAKTFPWPNAANVKYPLLTTAAIQFNARAYPAIVPGKDIVKVKVNGDDSGLFEVIPGPDGQPQMNPETGEPLTKEIRAPGAKQDRADRVGRHMSWQLGDEMEEWESETDRLLVVLPIVGCVFRKTYFDSGKGRNCSHMILPDMLYVDYDAKSLEDAPRITQEFELYPNQIVERIRSGVYINFEYTQKAEDHDAPQTFYEQHRLLDLDDDGYAEPYVVTVHEESQTVVRIVARFYSEDVEINPQGEVSKIKPIHYFTKYGFIPNPDSAIYDLGFGMLLNPINETVNVIINQMLDAGTIQNAGGGFIGRGLRIKGGQLRFRPGEYKPVEVSGGKIADNLYHMDHKGPSPVLFNLLGLMIEAGKEIASIKDVLTGESTGANASPTTTIAMIEQGLKAFTAIFKRVHRSLKSELAKLYDLNRRYLPQESYFTFLDSQEAIANKDYADDQDVSPVSDPTVVTDMQKMAKAQFLAQYKGDPFVNQMELRKREMDAAGIDNVESLLQEPPQPGPPLADQIKAMELELEGMERKQLIPSEIAKNIAAAIKDIAEAESKEAGIQLDAYRAFIERLNVENQSRTVPGMAGESGNGSIPAIPQ